MSAHSQVGTWGLVGRGGQRLDRLALGRAEVGRHRDLDGDEQVARALRGRYAATLHAERATGARAGRHAELHGAAVDGGHGQIGAERSLRERDRHGEREGATADTEQLVRRDTADHVEVAGRTAVAARTAAALQADALAVGDAGGDAHLDLAWTALHPRTMAGRARVLDDHPVAAAARARRAEREHPLVVLDHAAAGALRAHDRRGAGARAAAVAGRTRRVRGQVDGGGDPLDRVGEREVQLRFEVLAALRPGAPARSGAAATEEASEDVAQPAAEVLGRERVATRPAEAAGRAGAAAAEHAAHRAHAADLVVLLALVGVADHVVGGRDLLEAVLRGVVTGV